MQKENLEDHKPIKKHQNHLDTKKILTRTAKISTFQSEKKKKKKKL